MLFRIWRILNLRCSLHASVWAVCLTAFFGMFRKSNLLPYSASGFDSNTQLTKADFTFKSCRGVLVHMKWSKAIQFRDRAVLIPFSFIPDSPLCPVQAIQHAFSFLSHSKYSSQAFNYLDSTTVQPVCFTYTIILRFLRTCLDNIGCNSSLYAGHSFRRGGVSFAFQAGVPVEMIKLLDDWKSDTVLYLTVLLQMRMTSNNV